MQSSRILTSFYTDQLFLPTDIIRTLFHKRNRVLRFKQSILLFMQIAHSCIARTASKHALVKSDELLPRRKMTLFQSLREQAVEKKYGAMIIVYV
jgi:hypothetical protein